MKKLTTICTSLLLSTSMFATIVTGTVGNGNYTDWNNQTSQAFGLDFNNDGVFVIEDNNKIVAFLHAPKINETELEFALSVLQEYEGKGLGTKMFERAYKWACEKGFKKIVSICLSSNKGMQSIVRKYDDAKIQSVEYNVQEGTIELPDNTMYNPIYAYMSYFTDNIKMFEIGVKRHLNNV